MIILPSFGELILAFGILIGSLTVLVGILKECVSVLRGNRPTWWVFDAVLIGILLGAASGGLSLVLRRPPGWLFFTVLLVVIPVGLWANQLWVYERLAALPKDLAEQDRYWTERRLWKRLWLPALWGICGLTLLGYLRSRFPDLPLWS